MRYSYYVLLVALFITINPVSGQLRQVDRVRLAEAFRLNDSLADSIWAGWRSVPFAIVLVADTQEFLLRHPKPSPDFTSHGYDSLLESEVYSRPRQFSPHLLASFPAIPGSLVPTIVVGQAESTDVRTSTRWVVTLMHEHFHQYQLSDLTYYEEVDSLKLSRGDNTGIWMLNYPFPYRSEPVTQAFNKLRENLLKTINSKEDNAKAAVDEYIRSRKEFAKLLHSDDYRYFSFQAWQEGISRYTEYLVASRAASNYQPSKEFQELPDYQPFGAVAEKVYRTILDELKSLSLAKAGRVCFYSFGAAEGILLDRKNSPWKSAYLREKFFLEHYFQQ